MKRPLVAANWKMNPQTISEVAALSTGLKRRLTKVENVDCFIAPPTIYLQEVAKRFSKTSVSVVAQSIHPAKLGPFTGFTSVSMIESIGVGAALVGHSERRDAGERDAFIHEQLQSLLKAGMTAILCVGERSRDSHGRQFIFVEKQLTTALTGIPKKQLARLVIAYEPIWALSKGDGKGKTATPHDAHEMKLFIVKTLTRLYGRAAAHKVRILYGGSVNEKNAEELFVNGEVDGFLVGGASLKPDSFGKIVNIVTEHAKK